MTDYFNFIFSAPNIIPTFILCFCVAYWLIVIVGMIDMDMIDVDIDIDIDADLDIDADVSSGGEIGVAWLNKVLHFFNLGRIPFMVWLTIVGLIAWFGSTAINFMFGIDSFLIGTVVFLGVFIGSVIITKPLTYPLVKMFDALEKSDGIKSVIGQIGEIIYPPKGTSPGEVDINYEGSHIRVFVIPTSEEIVLTRDQKVLIIAPSDDDAKIYLVEPYN